MSKLLHTAIERAKAGHDKYPNDASLLMLLARLAKETGQTNSSVAYLEKILALRPDNTEAALTLANLFLELQDPPNARKVLMDAERYVEDSLELQEMLAQINEAMGDDPGTISALNKILELKGEAPEIRKKLAGYQVKQGNYQDALTHYEVLEKQGRITPELRQDYAKCLRATGRTQDALDVLKELLRDNPSDVETARFLADIYLQKEDYFNAKLFLEATRRADTTNPEVHYLIGTTCLKLDDDNCALEAFQKAVELDPEKLEYVENLANLLYKKSRNSEGERRRQYLKQARKYFLYVITSYERKDMPVPEDRRNADVYFNHGQILFETGHYEKALRDLDKAMALAKHRVDMLVMYADILYKMNRYKEAVKYYQEMLDSKLDEAHAYFYLGKIHLVRDQREKAKAYFLQCIALGDKAYPDAHKHLGDIFREKRLRKKAIDHYRTFLKLTPANDPAAEEVKASLKRL
jgi:tetratricopeptide (TPR) repeat protein